MTLSFINSLEDLGNLLKLLKESGVKVFRAGELHVLMDDVYETEDEDEGESGPDKRSPTSPMGFETTDLRGLGIATEFDEE